MRTTVSTAAQQVALAAFRRLPVPARRAISRRITPRYSVGALCALRCDGRILMLRQRHHHGWTLPGGLLGRGENPEQALRREMSEELSLDVALPSRPTRTSVDPAARQVDLLYVVDVGSDADLRVRADGVEVLEAAWRAPDAPGTTQATAAVLALLDPPGE